MCANANSAMTQQRCGSRGISASLAFRAQRALLHVPRYTRHRAAVPGALLSEVHPMSASPVARDTHILDPGFELTLRPMKYPQFYEMYRSAIRNTWTVEEVDFSLDTSDLKSKMSDADRHLIHRLVAFFATGDTIVSNNLVLNLYQHVNSPEARMYLSRQLYEEALHVQFYLTLLDTYIPEPSERNKAFAAIESIPSIRQKGEFCFKWIDSIQNLNRLETREHRRQFLLNLICFAACIEGLFFFAAFAYVYYLRSRGLLHGLASGTNWVFRDESGHMAFAFEVVRTVREQEPDLFDDQMRQEVEAMLEDAIACETQFAADVLSGGVAGLSVTDMRQYLEYCADQRLVQLDMPKKYGAKNPFDFMDLQDVQELTNFFERRVSSYQVGVQGEVAFDQSF
jgi:ribonucleoside-diphosphate reductase beta chain